MSSPMNMLIMILPWLLLLAVIVSVVIVAWWFLQRRGRREERGFEVEPAKPTRDE